MTAEFQRASEIQTELRQRIQVAEEDLKEMAALMERFQAEGKQQEYGEVDNAYQQAYPDYTRMLRQLGEVQEELDRLESLLKPIDEYRRDTGFYPGL